MEPSEVYGLPESNIAYDIFFNIGGSSGFMRWGIYIFIFISLYYLIYTFLGRRKLWKQGRDEYRINNPFKRFFWLLKSLIFQSKIKKDKYAFVMHLCFFYGFSALVFLGFFAYLLEEPLSFFYGDNLLSGSLYLYWSFCRDILGLVLIFAVALAFYRRYILKPEKLDNQKSDFLFLFLLFSIVMTGFLTEAARISLIGYPDFEQWAPVGFFIAGFFKSVDASILAKVHYIIWWINAVLVLSFVGLMGTRKPGHMLYGLLNIYFQNIENHKSDLKYRVMLTSPFYSGTLSGVRTAKDFTWKQLLDLDACMRCGRCQERCPSWLASRKLSPKKFITSIKENMQVVLDKYFSDYDADKKIMGDYVTSEELWACTGCAACVEECPVEIDHLQKIIDLRRAQVKDKEAPSQVTSAFDEFLPEVEILEPSMADSPVSSEEKSDDEIESKPESEPESHPESVSVSEPELKSEFEHESKTEQEPDSKSESESLSEIESESISESEPASEPVVEDSVEKENFFSWIPAELGIKTLAEDSSVDYLLYLGCTVFNSEENQKSAIRLIKILHKLDIKVGILGNEEVCCGDTPMRLGNDKLFQQLAILNIKSFNKYHVNKIITLSPHAYNIFKKEYKQVVSDYRKELLSMNLEVYHYTDLIHMFIKEGKIELSVNQPMNITYHDPCFLGRYNNKYRPARDILKTIPGSFFIEMNKNKSQSLCCGSGAGIHLIKDSGFKEISELRAREAHSTGAEVVATACPKCNYSLNNAFTELGITNIVAKDIATLVYDSIFPQE